MGDPRRFHLMAECILDLSLIILNYAVAIFGTYVFFLPWSHETPLCTEWVGNISLVAAVLVSHIISNILIYRQREGFTDV
jgi:hypothetical protein